MSSLANMGSLVFLLHSIWLPSYVIPMSLRVLRLSHALSRALQYAHVSYRPTTPCPLSLRGRGKSTLKYQNENKANALYREDFAVDDGTGSQAPPLPWVRLRLVLGHASTKAHISQQYTVAAVVVVSR